MLSHIAFCGRYQVVLSGTSISGRPWSAIVATAGTERDAFRAFRAVAASPDVPPQVFGVRANLVHRGRELSARSLRV